MATIYEKLHAVMQNVKYLEKDDQVRYNTTNYKALSEEKVTSIMREQFIQQRLVVFPVEMQASRSGQISHVDVKYRIVNVDDPTDYIEVVSCGDGADSQDKVAGKAMTYSFKYMWLRTLAIPTGEDPDKISSDELTDRFKADKPEPKPDLCEECGRVIEDYIDGNGKRVKASRIATTTFNQFHRFLCMDCATKRMDACEVPE